MRLNSSCTDYTWSAGDVFDGCMSGGARHGPCTYTFFNGRRINCEWRNGHCPEFNEQQQTVLAEFSKSKDILEKIGIGGEGGVTAAVQRFRIGGELRCNECEV